MDWVLAFVTLGIGWMIWAFILSSKGQTPGKRMMKLRSITLDTNRPSDSVHMIVMRGIVGGIVAGLLWATAGCYSCHGETAEGARRFFSGLGVGSG